MPSSTGTLSKKVLFWAIIKHTVGQIYYDNLFQKTGVHALHHASSFRDLA